VEGGAGGVGFWVNKGQEGFSKQKEKWQDAGIPRGQKQNTNFCNLIIKTGTQIVL